VGNFQTHIDQLGEKILIPVQPTRIVSLVPSQTELLADLGLENQIVGITKFCVHPPAWKSQKNIIGGTKKFDFEKIRSLNPDLIIGNKEENYIEGIELLRQIAPVWMSNIISIDDALHMVCALGAICDRETRAAQLATSISASLKLIDKVLSKTVLYLIWHKPWMAAGSDTFINTMIGKTGLENCLGKTSRYPILSNAEIEQLNPDFIFLSSEPFPFKQKHLDELKQIVPSTKIILVDGEMFSWYGSRLKLFAVYFNATIRPQLR
jgi:ABC-type Fe3+-hydroxamate transport system substrate-binding protein